MSNDFVRQQREEQARYFAQNIPDHLGVGGTMYRLPAEQKPLNLHEDIRTSASLFFAADPEIKWHTHAAHGLSSQACCVNFLFPFVTRPELLSRWIGQIYGIAPPEVEPVDEDRGLGPSYLTFEWIGDRDYLNEDDGHGRARGANATAADAAVQFRTAEGQRRLVLIEWKYTEAYGAPLSGDRTGKRLRRYGGIAFHPSGPIKSDLGLELTDFFWEPFYQLLRQQTLAWHIEADESSGFDRVDVLHLSPSANLALHRVTSPKLTRFGEDAFEVFKSLLVEPDRFCSMSTDIAFSVLAEWPEATWFADLRRRYSSLITEADGNQDGSV